MYPIFRLVLPLAAIALAASVVRAQATIPGSAAPEPEVVLAPLVVTAATSERPLVVVLDPKAPAQPVPAQDGADVLKAVPGFSVIRKGGTDGDPVLRGMAGSRLGIVLDGQSVLGGCGNRMDPPTAYVLPATYDRVTILKGPQTVLHGPGNSAGVVLFERDHTRPGSPETGATASATAASFGRRDALVEIRGGTPDVSARGSLTRSQGGDYEDGAGRRVHAAHDRWSMQGAVSWTPDARSSFEITAVRSDGEAAYADRGMDGVAFDREGVVARARFEDLTPLVASVEVQWGFNFVDHVMDNYSLRTFTSPPLMPYPAVSNPDRRTTGGRLAAELIPGEGRTRLALGVDQQSNAHRVRASSNQPSDPYQAKPRMRDAEFHQWGVFGEVTRDLGGHGRLVAGGRLDAWRVIDHRARIALGMAGSVPNPSAGRVRESLLSSGFVRYEHRLAATPAVFYAGVGSLSRFSDYWELIKNEGAASVSAFGTRPEKTTQLDLGMHATVGSVELAVSAFASGVRDFALVQSRVARPAGMGGTRMAVITRNVDASTWGGEASAGWHFAEHWRADATLAYTRGTNRTDDRPLAQIPPLESRLGMSYGRSAWSFGGLVRWVADQDRVAVDQGNIVGQDLGPSEGFCVASLHASWRASPRLRLTAGVDNVFDTAYAEHISRAGGTVAGYAQTTRVFEPGRVLWLKLDLAL